MHDQDDLENASTADEMWDGISPNYALAAI